MKLAQKQLLIAVILSLATQFGIAQQTGTEIDHRTQVASNAANPLAFITKLQFQPDYTFLDSGGDQLSLISRLIQPTKSIGLPFIESKNPGKIYTIYRLEVPLISQTAISEQSPLNATGVSDLIFLDAIVFKKSWGILGK